MDTQKLYRVAQDILTEFTEEDITGRLANLTSYIGQNTAAGFESASETRKLLNEAFKSSVTNYYALTYLEIVDFLGASDYVGVSGQLALEGILNSSPLELATKLEAYVIGFNLLLTKLKKLTESLRDIGIEPYELAQYEIGYIIPADLDDLSDVTKRLTHYNKFLSVASSIAGETDNTVHLSRMSNGTLEFFVLKGVGVAKIVDVVLKRVVELYEEVQKIKKIAADIENVKADTLKTKTEALVNLLAMEKEYSEAFVEDTVKQVMVEYEGDKDFKPEIGVQLGVTIKLLLKDIQSGIKVEVSPPYVEETEKQSEEASSVLDSITATNIALIDLYSKPREELKLPSGLEVSTEEVKKLDRIIKSKKKAAPKQQQKRGSVKKPKGEKKS